MQTLISSLINTGVEYEHIGDTEKVLGYFDTARQFAVEYLGPLDDLTNVCKRHYFDFQDKQQLLLEQGDTSKRDLEEQMIKGRINERV